MHQSHCYDESHSTRSTGAGRLVPLIILCILVILPGAVYGANVTIPTFQLLTRGILDSGQFTLQTAGQVEIEFGGGYKFGGQLSLALNGTNLEQAITAPDPYDASDMEAVLNRTLRFQSASVVVRDLFGIPLDATYFIGEVDRLLNGDVFADQFGSDIIASDFRGLLYFPTGIVYDGLHALDGTGIALSSKPTQSLLFQGAIYQDAYLDPGKYSADLRAAFNTPSFKAEAFVGASFPAAAYGIYRGGLLLFYNTGQGGEFFSVIGVPRWAPVTDGPLRVDDLYFLFEPRVHINFMSIVLTLFRHPEYYNQRLTNELQATDILVRFIAGDVQENVVSGGLESGITLRPVAGGDALRFGVTPFVSVNASGVIWDLKTSFSFDFQSAFPPDDFFNIYVGVRTEF